MIMTVLQELDIEEKNYYYIEEYQEDEDYTYRKNIKMKINMKI